MLSELSNRLLDLIIIGAGPAGMSASIYAARRKIDTLIITENIGGQTNWSAEVENYLGFTMISGYELGQKFYEHVKKIDAENDIYDLELIQNDIVVDIKKDKQIFVVKTKLGKEFSARSILIATGAKPRTLDVPGEKELIGKGVTFCATCDGPFYYDKTIAVVGGGNSAMEAILYLSKIAKKIYSININNDFKGEMAMADEINKLKNVEVKTLTETLEFIGKQKLAKIRIKNINNNKEEWIDIDGVFEEIGYLPNSEVFAGLVRLNKKGEVIIGENNDTSMPGLFAAGDVSSVPSKQIVIAAGEGAKAALWIYNYLLPK